jgi:hypothetical protein
MKKTSDLRYVASSGTQPIYTAIELEILRGAMATQRLILSSGFQYS